LKVEPTGFLDGLDVGRKKNIKNDMLEPGMVVHVCNPYILNAEAGRS
jgi:hypothetical protein